MGGKNGTLELVHDSFEWFMFKVSDFLKKTSIERKEQNISYETKVHDFMYIEFINISYKL